MAKQFSITRLLVAFAFVAIIGLPSVYAAGADLSVSIATPVVNILKGDPITYKVSVRNNGPTTALSFTLTDVVPAGLTFDSASAPVGCSLVGSTVTCTSGTLGVNAVRMFALKFSTASAACDAVITNSASVSSSADTNAGNDTSNTVSTTIACPDFSITKSAPASVAKGDILQYVIKVANNGPSVLQTVTMTDAVPAGLTFDSATTGCASDGSTVTCSARIAAGSYRNFILKFSTAPAACGAVINNTASISSSVDPNASNDTSNTVSTTVGCPDFFITKSAPVTVLKGDLLSYTVKVTNNGPLVAQTFTMTDNLPAGLTFDSAPVGCSFNGSAVVCSAKLAFGASRSFILKYATASAVCGSVLSNTATVSSPTDQNPSNDTSNTVTTTVMCQEADFSITKSGPASVEKGAALIYSITVANAGPTVANGVAHDVIPAGLTFLPLQSSKQCKVVGSAVDCNGGNLATGKSVTFTLAFGTSAAACSSTIQNVATVIVKGAIDPNTANNTSNTMFTDVTCASVCPLNSLPPAVQDFVNAGYITQEFACANIGENAVRKDFIRLVVELNGGILNYPPSIASFDDVPLTHSHFGWYEESGVEGWVRGDNNCYGTHPCFERPEDSGIRGYFALVASRAFGLDRTGAAPQFVDNPTGTEMATAMQAMADHCILLPNAAGDQIFPNDVMLFEDMISALKRIDVGGLEWGEDCGPPAVIENELTITQKATATMDAVVKNQKNVSLLRLEGRTDNEDILTTSFIFDAAQGSLVNAQNFAFWVDTDGNGTVDTILQKGVSPTSGKVTFDALAGGGYVIPATQSIIFEVHADIAASLVDDKLQLKFATSSDYIAAERLLDGSPISGIKTNGTCATACEITVTTQQATIYTIHSQGELFIQKSTTPTRPRMALGGALSDEVMRLQFHSEYEDIDVTDLVFTATGPNAGTFATNVDRIELYKVGSVTLFATATVSSCGSTSVPSNSMCAAMNSQEFIIPKGSNTNILVRLRMRTDTDGSVSGQHVQLTVDAVAGAQARGLLSSNNLLQNDGDGVAEGELFIGVASPAPSQTIVASDNVVVHSKVTSITNASPDANGTAIPSGNQRQIGQFKFSTAAASNLKNGTNKWTLSDIMFNVNATNVLLGSGDQTSLATSDFSIYNKADPTSKSVCTANKASASGAGLAVTCSDITSSSVNSEIDPGTDVTFVLEAEVVNAKISNSSTSTLQVSLQNFTDINASGFSLPQSHVRWLDKDNASSTPFLWIEYPETSINGTTYNG